MPKTKETATKSAATKAPKTTDVDTVTTTKSTSSKQKDETKVSSKASSGKMFTVQQTGSPQRRDRRQSEYLKSLGLGKMNRVKTVIDNDSTRGLLKKLQHMVKVIEG
jgi:large subunit ribosomal protein L30